MTVKEVAEIAGCDALTIRIALQQGKLPIGVAIKLQEGNKRFKYIIYEQKVYEYFGKGR